MCSGGMAALAVEECRYTGHAGYLETPCVTP